MTDFTKLANVTRDKKYLEDLAKMLEAMSKGELERFYRGTFNVLTVADVILQRRFPTLHKKIDDEIMGGTEPMRIR